MSEAIRIDQYTMIKLEDGGQYGFKIVEGWENRDGEFKPTSIKRRFGKNPEEKSCPLSVKLGDRKTAIGVLQMLLKELGVADRVIEDPDIPF